MLLGRVVVLRAGRWFAVYVVGYGLGRLWVESLRIDFATEIAGLRVNTWISLVAIVGGLVWLFWRGVTGRHRGDRSAATRRGPARPGRSARGRAGRCHRTVRSRRDRRRSVARTEVGPEPGATDPDVADPETTDPDDLDRDEPDPDDAVQR